MSDLAAYQDYAVKAPDPNPENTRQVLTQLGAHFAGIDQQRDTYFAEARGKLKLREGTIEHLLIHYERLPDAQGAQRTRTYHYEASPSPEAVAALFASRAVLGVVEKVRRIYFLSNVKFHQDTLPNGGQFIEVEAMDKYGQLAPEQLRQQCLAYLTLFGIEPDQILPAGYGPQAAP
ncbi:class IV adenylate cyclase [Hymenobacter sp. BT730]|uniref:class IV adenylate cyclase n=1 Tax=Hymenobacter sp. BT730 TaxID=3063332 RepID=UPI0026E039C8|nr:class IV adenylate cyclase [Hymenobacter sp. BT730]